MTKQLSIRRVVMEDADKLSQLSASTFYDTFKDTCTADDMNGFLKAYFNIDVVRQELSDPADFYYFAEINDRPVGYIRFKEEYDHFPLMKKWRAMELKRFYVVKEFHGRGVAQQLMDFLVQYCMANNYEVLWLGVWEHNSWAQKFYLKNGFQNSGYTHYFPIGKTPQTDIWFWKFL